MELSIISEKLEDIRNYLDVELHPVVSPDRWDVYSELCNMVDDIIALLKAQEAVKPKPYDGFSYLCGKCERVISGKYSNCPWCGRAVKWE